MNCLDFLRRIVY